MSEKYDDGDPYKSIREKYMEHHPPEKVRELIRKIDQIDPGGDMYGNLGKKVQVMTQRKQRDQFPMQQKSAVGRVDVEIKDGVTICADCVHCVPSVGRSGKDALAYAKCSKTADHIPDTVNVITGEKISKIPSMDYCSNKNHGECPDWESKKLHRGEKLATPAMKKLREMLDDPEMILDDDNSIPWEDVKRELSNPWKTTLGRIKRFFKGFKIE